jgi:Terminase small subunit.
METTRQQLATCTTDDVDYIDGEALTPKQERFAQLWAKYDNQSAAYREAYEVGPKTTPASVWAMASRVANLPKVRARYQVLHEEAANEVLMSLREALQWQIDIATADPNELVRTERYNCRHCNGDKYGYQWKDFDEFMSAFVAATDALAEQEAFNLVSKIKDKKKITIPSEAGGYGFVGNAAPAPGCPHCYGQGVVHTIVADTSKLTGKARKLYAGAKEDRYGCIEIKMHDQSAAWDKILRMRGAYNDKLDLRTPEQRAAETAKQTLPDNISIEDAQKAYLDLLG